MSPKKAAAQARAPQVVLSDTLQYRRLLRTADENLADQFARVHFRARGIVSVRVTKPSRPGCCDAPIAANRLDKRSN